MAATESVIQGTNQANKNTANNDRKAKGSFEPIDIKNLETPKEAQVLGKAEGSRLAEPFRVAGALAHSVIKTAYSMYDNARTDLRVANAAKEMEKFNPEQITQGASVEAILNAWTQTAEKHQSLKDAMVALGGAAAGVITKTRKDEQALRENIKSALDTKLGDTTLSAFASPDGASKLSSLSPEQKREFLEAYDELRKNLGGLNSIVGKATEQARAFYEHSMKPFEAFHEFKERRLEPGARKHYESSLKEIHKTHLKSLKDASTTEEIKKAGETATEAIRALQGKVSSLSKSLKSAEEVESRVSKTLGYLIDGIGNEKAVSTKDESVVFVGVGAADKIAGWVDAQTKEAKKSLEVAKKSKDPEAIATATEELKAASDMVHKQLDDVAALLSKINAGQDREGRVTEGVRERIIAKATSNSVEQENVSEALTDYISALNTKMGSLVAGMFSDPANPSVGTGELKKFVAQHHDRVEFMITRDATDGLTSEEVNQALRLAAEALQEKSVPEKNRVELANEEFGRQAAQRVAELEKQPKQSFFSRLRSWFVNN
jgi:hypothetical protein